MQNPNQLLEILWGEEINLAATGAVALALAAGRRGPWVQSTADLAFAPDLPGMSIKALHPMTETGSAGPGTFTIAEDPRSPYDICPVNTGVEPFHYYFPGPGIRIPNRATLGFNGPVNAGATQVNMAAWLDVPGFNNGFNFSGANAWDDMIRVRPTTAARVAATQSGDTDICGRAVAYTGAQLAIPNDPNITMQIIRITSNDVAGYSGIGLRGVASAAGQGNLTFLTPATYATEYDMMEIFGGYPTCTAATPFQAYGIGDGVAPNTLSEFLLGLTYGK